MLTVFLLPYTVINSMIYKEKNMFEEHFARKEYKTEKLLAYGFKEESGAFSYEASVMNGDFRLVVRISSEGVDTELIETESGEPYVLYKMKSSGVFVGEVRSAIEVVLRDIAEKCFENTVYQSRQAVFVKECAKTNYDDELEFLWPKFPTASVLRRKDNKKWYAVLMTVDAKKLGLDGDKVLEIIDLRMKPEEKEGLLVLENHFPGWHMNKNSWFTLILDGGTNDEDLKTYIEKSRILAKMK